MCVHECQHYGPGDKKLKAYHYYLKAAGYLVLVLVFRYLLTMYAA